MQKKAIQKFLLPIILMVGLVIIVLFNYMGVSYHQAFEHNVPVQKAQDYAQKSLATAHLWFEEAMSGDESIHPEKDVYPLIEEAGAVFHALRLGGSTKIGSFVAAKDPAKIKLLTEAEEASSILLQAAKTRWSNKKDGGHVGDASDQQFDQNYETVIAKSKAMAALDEQELLATMQAMTYMRYGILVAALVVFSLMALLIVSANKGLQKQLQLGEQQYGRLMQQSEQLQEAQSLMEEKKQEVEAALAQSQSAEEELRQQSEELLATQEEISQSQQAVAAQNQALLLSQEEMQRVALTLQEKTAELEKSKTALEAKQFVDSTIAKFANLLRLGADETLNQWATRALRELVPYLDGLQASIYIRELRMDNRFEQLELLATYAININDRKSCVPLGDGIVGEAASSRRTFRLPLTRTGDSLRSTAMGEVSAKEFLAMPLIYNNNVEGVLELSTLAQLDESKMLLLQTLSETIAASMLTARNQEQMKELYNESEEKAQMLMAQEEEMRQNMEELQATQDEMNRIQQNLQNMVAERTQVLTDTMEDMKNMQVQLVQNEKMASLGQLIAGVAHEINTPIGAVKAAATNMMDILTANMAIGNEVASQLAAKENKLMLEVVKHMVSSTEMLGAKEERALKRKLSLELEAAKVAEAEDVADQFVSAGFYASLLPYLPLIQHPKSTDILQYLNGQGMLLRNLRNIQVATNKTAKVVFALKTYSHTQQTDALVPFNLKENIETVLVLYSSTLKKGIDLQTNLLDVPQIMGNPDELGQVWTNVIQNAAQAMNYNGAMNITLERQNGHALVMIQDNGKGIAPENVEKVFDPFFTTKARGEGTGLGLDICKKIVEKHNGKIYVQSKPGDTRFYIELPIAQHSN